MWAYISTEGSGRAGADAVSIGDECCLKELALENLVDNAALGLIAVRILALR